MYQVVTGEDQKVKFVILEDNGVGGLSWIPAVAGNSDYAKYLEWVAEGNEATEYAHVDSFEPSEPVEEAGK